MAEPVERLPRLVWKDGVLTRSKRAIPNEVAIAGSTQSVMMATPANLEDFAVVVQPLWRHHLVPG